MDKLVYQSTPIVTFATNKFINVPVIFQYEETPLIETIYEMNTGYTSSVSIYDKEGKFLAKINGTRIYSTEYGKKAGITVEEIANKTICKMKDRVLFEVHHQSGDGFKLYAELYTPDGNFVKIEDKPLPALYDSKNNLINTSGDFKSGNVFINQRLGILLKKDGKCLIGST